MITRARPLAIVAMLTVAVLGLPLAWADEPPTTPVLRIESGMHSAPIRAVASDAAGRYVVTGSDDKTIRVWDASAGRLLRVLRPPIADGWEGIVYAVAMSPDGATIAAAGSTGAWDNSTRSIYLFDRQSGHVVRRITGLPDDVTALAWSPDGRYLAAALQGKNGIRVFRVKDGTELGRDIAYGDAASSVDIARNGKLVSTSYDDSLRLYTIGEQGLALVGGGPLGTRTSGAAIRPRLARFSPDGTKIAVASLDDVEVLDLSAGRTYSPALDDLSYREIHAVAWSSDGRHLYAAGVFGGRPGYVLVRSWAEAGRGRSTDVPAHKDDGLVVAAVPVNGGVVYASESSVRAMDTSGRKRWEQRATIVDFRANGIAVSEDGMKLQFGSEHGARFDVRTRQLAADTQLTPRPSPDGPVHRLLDGGTVSGFGASLQRGGGGGLKWSVNTPGMIGWVEVSRDGRFVVASLLDGTVRWYRARDGKELFAFFPHADRKRWVLWTPAGYYDASPGAEDLIGWHVNRGKDTAADFYPVSRFRAAFYRPDVLAKVVDTLDEAEALRLADAEAGRKAQTVDVAKALPPIVEILSPADGATVLTPDVRVKFAVRTSADAPVLHLKARVNGQVVAIQTARDVVVEGTGGAREATIPIPPHDSDIMLFAENRYGVSAPAVVGLRWTGRKTGAVGGERPDFVVKPKLYVLAVGVSRYPNPDWTLQYAAKDARDFAKAMLEQKNRLYRDVEIKVLTDAQATKDDVLDGLDWLQRQATARDVAMLFLAGHGVKDSAGIYYYLPVNADVERLKRTGVPFSDIKNTLAALTGKAVFFVDTCHSGNVMGGRRGVTDVTGVVNELASAENGVVVFASSTGRQYSLEGPQWNNGAFTKALVEGITGKADLQHTGRITHKMLDYYVAERVKQLTNGQQTPVNVSPEGVPDFPIALVK